MGNKPSNTTGGSTGVPPSDSRRQTSKAKRSTLSNVKQSVGGGAPVVPLGPKNYVDMGFPEEDPNVGRWLVS